MRRAGGRLNAAAWRLAGAGSAHAQRARAAADWAGTRRIRVSGWDIRFREAGSGPAVVLVHGLGISADYWTRNAVPLAAAGFRVLAPDLPGFGRTDGPPSGLTIAEQADVLERWAAAVGIGRAAFAGHSVSCQSVLSLAADRPDRVRALILIALTGARVRYRMLREAAGLLVDALIEPWPLMPLVALDYLRAGPRRYWGTWRASARNQPLDLLPRVRCPVAVVVGTRDPVVSPRFAQALARGANDGRLIRIRGGSHATQFSRPAAFNAAAIAFQRSL